MVSKKPTILVLVGTLLIAWLLVSAIRPIQPMASSGGGGASGSTSTSTQLGGGGGGVPTFLPPTANFTLFKLPSFNFHLPDLFHFNFTFPSFGGFGTGSGEGGGLGSGGGVGGGGLGAAGGGGGTQGSGGGNNNNNNQATSTNSAKTPPLFSIPKELLIAIIIIVLVVAGLAFAVRSRSALARNKNRNNLQAVEQVEEAPLLSSQQIASDQQQEPLNVLESSFDLVGDEIIVDFEGWGTQGGFLRPRIREDLPLIWSLDGEALEVEAPAGTLLSLGRKDAQVEGEPDENDGLLFPILLKAKCNALLGNLGEQKDLKWVRAVRYDEDVVRLFRLNLLKDDLPIEELKSMTPRELVEKVVREKSESVKDRQKLVMLTRVFERAFYGKKAISRDEFESFLTNLSGALKNPKVIICGPKNSRDEKKR